MTSGTSICVTLLGHLANTACELGWQYVMIPGLATTDGPADSSASFGPIDRRAVLRDSVLFEMHVPDCGHLVGAEAEAL